MRKMMRIAFATKCGDYRVENEDSLLINRKIYSNTDTIDSLSVKSQYSQFMVADGLGGEAFGSKASNIALSCFSRKKNLSKEEIIHQLKEAKDKLDLFSLENKDITLGTTIAGIIIVKEKVIIFNMGDTRIYKIRNNTIKQLSKDHTYLSVEKTSLDQKLTLGRNYLTSALIGDITKPITSIYIDEFDYKENDIYLICSDGVWSELSESILLDIVFQNKPKIAVRKMIEKSNLKSLDNMSVICIK